MSNACKLLKILSFLFFVVGILSAGMGATALFAGSAAGDITSVMIVSCVVVIVLGVIEIVTAVFGIRAANNPAKAGVYIKVAERLTRMRLSSNGPYPLS